MAFRSAGGVAASFAVIDEFSGPLAAAEDQIGSLQALLGRAGRSTQLWANATRALGSALSATAPKMSALADAMRRAAPALTNGMNDAATSAAALDGSLSDASAAVARIKDSAAGLSSQFTRIVGAVGRLDSSLVTADDRMTALRTQSEYVAANMRSAATATAAMHGPRRLLPASGGGSGRGGGGGGGEGEDAAFGGGFFTGKTGKRVGDRLFSIPSPAPGFGVYESFKRALEMQYHVTAGVELFDPEVLKNPQALAADQARLTSLAFKTSVGTIYTAEQTAQAYAMLAAVLATAPAFQGKNKWKNFGALAPIVLRASEVATMQPLGSFEENMTAMAWFARLMGAYTPETMTGASNELLAIAERSHMKMPALERTLGYAIPLARGLGVNVSDTAVITGALIQGGLGSKAGVAVARVLTGLLQTGGPITAALQNALNSLGPDAIRYKGKALKPHLAGLHALGILGSAGHLTVRDKAGHIVWAKVIADIVAASQRLSKGEFSNAISASFGMRGSRAAMLFATLDKLMGSYEKTIKDTPTAVEQQAAFAATTQQQFEQVVARLDDIGNILATSALPLLTDIARWTLGILNDIDGFLGKHERAASLLSGAGLGAAVGWTFAGPWGALIGALAGGVAMDIAIAPRNPKIPKHMPGAARAAAALRGVPISPTGAHGDPLYLAPDGQLFRLPPSSVTVNVTAPQNVTIHADGVTPQDVIRALREANAQFSEMVRLTTIQAVTGVQKQTKRSTFLDPGYALGALP